MIDPLQNKMFRYDLHIEILITFLLLAVDVAAIK